MAVTTKTLTPTGQVVSIPDMTEKPNASVLSDGISKEADAINALADKFVIKTDSVTTNADGVAVLPSAPGNDNITVCRSNSTTSNYVCLPFRGTDLVWRIKVLNPFTLASIQNTTLSVTYYVIKN